MTTLAAGASTAIAIPLGSSIKINGSATAVVNNQPQVITNSGLIGPFSGAVTAYLTASSAVDYSVITQNNTTAAAQYGGPMSQAEIDNLNAAVAAGKITLPTSFSVFNTTTNTLWRFNGVALVDSSGTLVAPPDGFTFPFATIPFPLSKVGGVYSTTVSARDYFDPACWTGPCYNVDPRVGSDANTGIGNYDGDFKAATSIATYGKAITLGNAGGIPYRIAFPANLTLSLSDLLFGGVPVLPTQTVHLMSIGGIPYASATNTGRATLSVHANITFALDTGTTYVGTAPNTSPTNPVGRVVHIDVLNGDGDYLDLTVAASAVACRATVGSTFVDTTTTPNTVYVNRADGAVATSANTRAYVRQLVLGVNGTFVNKRYTFERISWAGGNGSGAVVFAPNNSTAIFAGIDTDARYAGATNGNGFGVAGGRLSILENWTCSGNQSDGYNVHDINNNGTVAISIRGNAYDNGRTGSTSCNGFTCHDGVRFIDFLPNYYDNFGGNSAHVSTGVGGTGETQGWTIGGFIGQSRGNPPGSSTLRQSVWAGGARLWFDGTRIAGATALNADAAGGNGLPGTILLRNCTVQGAQITAGGSTISTY